jgi:hypothetical protein
MEATAKKNLLPELINSLSANEKRYFSLFSSISPGEQNFKKLFKALEGETNYDSKKIHEKLGPVSMNVAYEKSYLQKMLLRSLRNFNEETSDEIVLHNLMIDIEVLYNKRHYTLCLDLIRKGRKLAEAKDLFPQHLLLVRWEKKCMQRSGNYDYLEKHMVKGLRDEMRITDLYQNFCQFNALQFSMLALLYRKGSALRKNDKAKLEEIIGHPLMHNVDC